MSDKLPAVSLEFLDLELSETIHEKREKISKRGGPYPKLERLNRRRRIFQLHFEQGYSIIEIAEKIRINRHTVSKDIEDWYKQLSKELETDYSNLILKHTYRLETQRRKLLKQSETQNGFHECIILEKMITDIDFKIAHMKLKSMTTKEQIIKSVIDIANKIVSKSEVNSHWVNTAVLYKVSKMTEKKVMKLINDDQRNQADYTLEEHQESQNS